MPQERALTMMVPAVVFSLVCGLLLTPGIMTGTFSSQAAAVEAMSGWQLTSSRVIHAGQTTQSAEGTLTTGFTVEAAASGVGAVPVSQGTFQLTASLFTPREDMPGQKAGMTYVHGNWTITDAQASVEARKARHSASVVKGLLNAELPFNPATQQGSVQARIQLSMSPLGKWSRGQGSFTGNEAFAGEISVKLERLPEAK
ncbi:MAG: hypothetical protein AB9873_03490 [Syntrophobacteraceae bacterium]